MNYDRKIRYLDYYERGMKIRGGGFAKLEVRDDRLYLELTVTGLRGTDTFVRDVLLCSEKREKEVGKIEITQGRGSCRMQWRGLEDIGGTGICYEELCGIRIVPGAGREISCRWQVQARNMIGKERFDRGEIKAAETVGGGDGAERDRRKAVGAAGIFGHRRRDAADGKEQGDGYGIPVRGVGESESDGAIAVRSVEESEPDRAIAMRGVEESEPDRAIAVRGAEESGPGGAIAMRGMEESEPGGAIAMRGVEESEPGGAIAVRRVGESASGMAVAVRRLDESASDKAISMRNVEVNGADRAVSGSDVVEHGMRKANIEGNMRNKEEASEVFFSGDMGAYEGGRRIPVRSMAGRKEREVTGEGNKEERQTTGAIGGENKYPDNSRKRAMKEEDARQKPVKLLDNKWDQLWAIYPHIRPFNDNREYISIGPSDFVVFPEEAYKMANNSFLLHGYYNYHHLLLAKVMKKGEMQYYIGVPGNFFEKEKQVAIMFGFESFECAEEPAQAGDFGYYMMRTRL